MIKLIDILKEARIVPAKTGITRNDITNFLNNNYEKFVKEFGNPKTKFNKQMNTAEDGFTKYEVASAGIDEDYGIDVSFSPEFMELADDYNDIEDVEFLGKTIYVNNYLNAAPEDEDELDEVKVKPSNTGIGGFWALIMTYVDECDVTVRIFRNEQEAKIAALEDNWELAYDNEHTELSKEEYVKTHSWEDPNIWYNDIRYEIVKVK
jgi:hypothetical protein